MSDGLTIGGIARVVEVDDGVEITLPRTGYTTYEIEISRDDKGYYFDIHQIDRVSGADFSVKQCIHVSCADDGAPFETPQDAIEAGKAWLRR